METLFRPDADDENEYENETPQEKENRLRLTAALHNLDAYITKCAARVKADIDKYPHKQTSALYYASQIGIDPKNLRQLFRAHYQVTVSQFRIQKRMETAIMLLNEGRFTLKQIATRCGYSNVNNLSRAFKRTFNQTPFNYLNSL